MATVLTNLGRAKILVATPMSPVTLKYIAFGDGGGATPTPLPTATSLVNEIARVECSNPIRDTPDASVISVKGMLPRTIGNITIREVGLYDNTNTLIGYGSISPSIVVPPVSTEYGYGYSATFRLQLDSASHVEVINADSLAFDHRSTTFRDEPDAHPASSIPYSFGRTVEDLAKVSTISNSATILLVGEMYLTNASATYTLPSTSGLASGSRINLVRASATKPSVSVNNTSTDKIRFGGSDFYQEFDSIIYDISHNVTLIWNGAGKWECSI